MRCALCEQPLDPSRQQYVRFSNTNPPRIDRFRIGAAGAIAAMGDSFASTVRAMIGTAPAERTYWFHVDCWNAFSKDLLVPDDG